MAHKLTFFFERMYLHCNPYTLNILSKHFLSVSNPRGKSLILVVAMVQHVAATPHCRSMRVLLPFVLPVVAGVALAAQAMAQSRSPSNPVRIGVLSKAGVTRGVLLLPAESDATAMITAVAARNPSDAEQLARAAKSLHGADMEVFETYDDLLNDEDVDAVYIPLPTGQFLHPLSRTQSRTSPAPGPMRVPCSPACFLCCPPRIVVCNRHACYWSGPPGGDTVRMGPTAPHRPALHVGDEGHAGRQARAR